MNFYFEYLISILGLAFNLQYNAIALQIHSIKITFTLSILVSVLTQPILVSLAKIRDEG